MSMATPSMMSTGLAMPVGMISPPSGIGDVARGRVLRGEPLRPGIAVGDGHGPQDDAAADDHEPTAAHMGRTGKP